VNINFVEATFVNKQRYPLVLKNAVLQISRGIHNSRHESTATSTLYQAMSKKALGRALQSWIRIFPSLNSSSFLAVSLSVSVIYARVMDYFPFYASVHVNNNVSQPNNSLQLFLKTFIDYS
jgi:hypothetical protein